MFESLKQSMNSYFPLSDKTWSKIEGICKPVKFNAGECFVQAGQQPRRFGFLVSGLMRAFVTDTNGKEYNKVFFEEGSFPGTMVALLTASPSQFTLDALEVSQLLTIDFKSYRELLVELDDLKLFHIYYLEKNWLVAKEAREVMLVQKTAGERYQQFLSDHPSLVERLPQFHIASHLGVTPTQLSRIRKDLAN